jgi:hypothetical protein
VVVVERRSITKMFQEVGGGGIEGGGGIMQAP